MGAPDPSALAAKMNQLWVRYLPEIEERVSLLERAASANAGGRLTAELCEEAGAAAHKLAGVLGTFGLDQGTVLAREAEEMYFSVPAADVPAGRAATIASQIRAIVASRAK